MTQTRRYDSCLACGEDHPIVELQTFPDGLDRFRCPKTSRELVLQETGKIALTDSRSPRDFYPTHSSLTKVMLSRWDIAPGARVLEPCAGNGAMANVLRDHGCIVTTNDIDARWCCDTTRNFIHPDEEWPRYDLVITNPPFQIAPEVVRKALSIADRVIMLLRLTWLEPCGNRRGLVRDMTRGLILQRCAQTDFSGGGGDSTTIGWFEWLAGQTGPCAIAPVYKSEIEAAGGQGVLL